MSLAPTVNFASEGLVDAAVARRLIIACGGALGWERPAHGKNRLDVQIAKYRAASAHGAPWLILRDFDRDAVCPSELIKRLQATPTARFCLRLAVREIETWLLADRSGIARSLRVPVGSITHDLEMLPDPKRYLIDLARSSRSNAVKAAIVPDPRAGQQQGPEYAAFLTDFVSREWNVENAVASSNSQSLCKAFVRLSELVQHARSD